MFMYLQLVIYLNCQYVLIMLNHESVEFMLPKKTDLLLQFGCVEAHFLVDRVGKAVL